MQIKYTSAVKTPAGWRPVEIVATATSVSPAMAVVDSVVTIDGETPSYDQTRTGAKRQSFNGRYFASQQIGAKKRLSSCQVVTP